MVLWTMTLHHLIKHKQKIIFLTIGGIAAAVHFFTVVALVTKQLCQPEIANIIAFIIATQISYWGHHYWTFPSPINSHKANMPKFFLIAALSFALNESLFIFLMKQFRLPYPVAIVIVLAIIPTLCFYIHKFWVFKYQ